MRESVLRSLAEKAATDPEFLASARRDLAGTLARHGFELTEEELRAVEDLRRRTAFLGTGTLAAMLATGLGERPGATPVRPAAPAQPDAPVRAPRRAQSRRPENM